MTEQEDIGDDEWLLRRIPEFQRPTETDPHPSPEAFRPHRDRDREGLSLFRESFISARELAARGRKDKQYFVGRIQAKALRILGMSLVPTPDPNGIPGHVLVPELNSATRKLEQQEFWQSKMAEIARVVGPFPGLS